MFRGILSKKYSENMQQVYRRAASACCYLIAKMGYGGYIMTIIYCGDCNLHHIITSSGDYKHPDKNPSLIFLA